MLQRIDLSKVLFLDIETVPQEPALDQLSPEWCELWQAKAATLRKDEPADDDLYSRAGIYAEFGKVVCVSVGYFNIKPGKPREFRLRSFYGHDERELLTGLFALLDRHFNRRDSLLCAHNGKEFDFPYLARRGVTLGLRLPQVLDMAGRKPWEVPHLDTMELWKFGDRKSYTSLRLLAATLGIATPKDDIQGKDVYRVYHHENDLSRIERYCRKDTLTVAQVVLRFRGEALLTDNEVVEA